VVIQSSVLLLVQLRDPGLDLVDRVGDMPGFLLQGDDFLFKHGFEIQRNALLPGIYDYGFGNNPGCIDNIDTLFIDFHIAVLDPGNIQQIAYQPQQPK
jgi:hypothetical protein